MTPARSEVWTRHWSNNAGVSCAGTLAAEEQALLAKVWHELAAGLPPQTRVLDIGTGGGAVPRLLMESRPKADLYIDAIDIAEQPAGWGQDLPPAAHDQVKFHADTEVEALPFLDASVDIVVSQFGLEYSNLPKAVPQIRRVLRRGGSMVFVLHHEASLLVQQAKHELSHHDHLLQDAGLLNCARAVIEPFARAATALGRAVLVNDAAANAAREAFELAQVSLQARATEQPCSDVLFDASDWVSQALQAAQLHGALAGEAVLNQAQQALIDSRFRLQELRSVAMGSQEVQALAIALKGVDGHAQARPLSSSTHVLGWLLQIQA